MTLQPGAPFFPWPKFESVAFIQNGLSTPQPVNPTNTNWLENDQADFSSYFKNKLVCLVVSTHLKNISQIGSFPQVGEYKIFETTT